MKVKKIQFVAVLLSISYIVVAGTAYKRVFDDEYYGELIRHGQTTEEAVVPFYLPQPVGLSGLQRRELTLFEYPATNLIAVPIGIFLTIFLLSHAWKRAAQRSDNSQFKIHSDTQNHSAIHWL